MVQNKENGKGVTDSAPMEIRFGDPDKTWRQHDLEQYPIHVGGKDTKYKAIFRDNKLVKVLGKDYNLFPNEEALKIADSAALLANLTPFSPLAPGMRVEGHVIYNKEETKMRAIYTTGKIHKVDGEEVNVGVNVFNAIDGSSSFGCGIFTFRQICGNGVIFGYEKIMQVRRIHTKGLQAAIEDMKAKMVLVMEQGASIVETYRQMAREKVTEKFVDKILSSRLPVRVLPDYIKEEEAKLPDVTQWQLYNDITALIWHSEKTGLQTKTFQFKTLHSIVPLQARQI
jgi:hypothetical protein